MKPVEFPQQNCTYAKDQPEYLPLPAHKAPDGQVVSCWELDENEALELASTRRIYLSVWTFNHPLQPVALTVKCPLEPFDG